MPFRDTIYTSPDALKLLYLNPKRLLSGLDDTSDSDRGGVNFVGNTITGPTNLPPGPGEPPTGCPMLDQYALIQQIGATRGIYARRVRELLVGMFTYNPISNRFEKLTDIEYLDQHCALVITNDGVQAGVSMSHPIIRAFGDECGRSVEIAIVLENIVTTAISCDVRGNRSDTEIAEIRDLGVRRVARLTTAGPGHIIATGATPDAFVLGHNAKPGGPGGGDIPEGGPVS